MKRSILQIFHWIFSSSIEESDYAIGQQLYGVFSSLLLLFNKKKFDIA